MSRIICLCVDRFPRVKLIPKTFGPYCRVASAKALYPSCLFFRCVTLQDIRILPIPLAASFSVRAATASVGSFPCHTDVKLVSTQQRSLVRTIFLSPSSPWPDVSGVASAAFPKTSSARVDEVIWPPPRIASPRNGFSIVTLIPDGADIN